MKKFTGFHKAALPIAAALILVLVASGPAAFGGSGGSLTVVGKTVNGNQVLVDVANSSIHTKSDQVWVEATVDGEVVYGFAPVTVFGRQSATVVVGFPSEIDGAVRAGLIDEGPTPF